MDEQKLDFLSSVNKNWSDVDEELKQIIKNTIQKNVLKNIMIL